MLRISRNRILSKFILMGAFFLFELPLFAGASPDGSYSESIPIEVPAGRNGVQPQLALVYSSNAGNGIAGVGWSLSGLPAITRIPFGRAVSYDGQDIYAGAEGRLIDVSASAGAAPGTVFHAEAEGWSKYEALGWDGNILGTGNKCGDAACSWRVTDRSGIVYLYGDSGTSRIQAITGSGAPINGGAIRVWALSRVVDLNSNYYEVEYYQNSGAHYPKKITYTLGNWASRYYAVTFDYDTSSRPDKEGQYKQSSYVQTNWRMREIAVTYRDSCLIFFTCSDPVRAYTLGYDVSPATNRSRLNSLVTTVSGQGAPLNSVSFTYSNGNVNSSFDPQEGTASGLYTASNLVGDFNGDGKDDVASHSDLGEWCVIHGNNSSFDAVQCLYPGPVPYVTPSSSSSEGLGGGSGGALGGGSGGSLGGGSSGTPSQPLIADFNGDGRADIAIYTGNETWCVLHGNASSFDSQQCTTSGLKKDSLHVADFNGDGRADIAVYSHAGSTTWCIMHGNANSFDAQQCMHNGLGVDGIAIGDFNGDGKADIAGYGSHQVWCVIHGSASSFDPQQCIGDGMGVPSSWVGDFNGDGKADIAGYGSHQIWCVIHGNESSFDSQQCIGSGLGVDSSGSGDFNGDGKADVAGYGSGQLWCMMHGNSSSFDPDQKCTGSGIGVPTTAMGDFNGDGRMDIAGYGNWQIWAVQHGGGDSNFDKLTYVTNLSGSSTSVEYSWTKDLPGISLPNTSSYPEIADSSNRLVVTKVTVTSDRNLRGGDPNQKDSFETRFEYHNARIAMGSATEKGSLGFEWIKMTDVNSGNYSITTNRQNRPFQNLAVVTRSYLSDNTLVSEQSSTPALQQYYCSEVGCSINAANDATPSAPRQIRATGQSESKSYENGILIGRKFQEVLSLDVYGNPLIVKSGAEANGSSRTVYKFLQYINENTATNRAIGIPYTEKVCYTVTECATGDTNFISESRVYYDNSALGAVGSRHLVTKRENYAITGDGIGVWLADEYTYDAAGNILTHLDSHGFTTSLIYESDYKQFPVSVTKSHGGKSSTVTAQYDARFGKKIVETIVDEGTEVATTLDATGFVTEVTVSNGSTVLAKNSSRRSDVGQTPIWGESCTHFGATFAQERCTKKFVDAMGRPYREEYPDLVNGIEKQMATEIRYDTRGRAVQSSQPFDAATGSPSQWNTKTYDNYGRTTQTQTFDGKITSTSFQTTGLPAGVVSCTISTDIDGRQQQGCNNIHGKTAFTVANYGATEATRIDYIYDGRGRLVSTNAPQGPTMIGYVGISGMQSYVDDPVSGRTDFTYFTQPGQGSFGQLASETRAGKTTNFEYNASFGRVSKITQPDSASTFIYDETDVEVGVHGINKPTTMIHQVDGYTIKERYRYNAKADMIEMKRWISHATEALCTDPEAMPCFQRYATEADDLERATSITYPDGSTTALTYVGATEHVAEIKHGGTTYATYSNYTYDVTAHIGKVTYGNGLVHDYAYQATTGVMQSVSVGKPSEPAKLKLVYAYDPSFNIASINDMVIPDLSVGYQYDALNRVRQATFGSGQVREYRFDQDGAGNKGNLSRKGNRRMTYGAGKTYPVSDEIYNESTGIWDSHQTMTWSPAGSLLTKGNFTYSYDSNQMMTKAVEANSAETQFVYDHTGQRFLKKHTLDGVTIKTWYLSHGIELREKYVGVTTGNPTGSFDSWQATKFIYGQDGKRITSITGNVKTSFIAPTPQQLFALADGYSSSTASGLAMKAYYTFYGIYAHESFGHVLRIILFSALALLLLLWLYFNSINEYQNFGRAFFRRLIAVSMLAIFVSVNCGQNSPPPGVTQGQINTVISELYTGLPTGTVYYSHNHLGSGSLVTDVNGDEIFRINYTEYGEIDLENSGKWNSTTETLEQNMSDAELLITAVKFTGQEYDPETGFYYYNARYYSAELGVFTTSDTDFDSSSAYGFNRHMYVGGNPIMATDPSGHLAWFVIPLIAAAVGGLAAATITAAQNNWDFKNNWGKIGAAFGVGALAGFVGALTGGAAAAPLKGLEAAVVGGMAGGAVGGFVGGAGTAWVNGASFGDGLLAGFAGGVTGALIGAATGAALHGIFGGAEGGSLAQNADDASTSFARNRLPTAEHAPCNYSFCAPSTTDVPITSGGNIVKTAAPSPSATPAISAANSASMGSGSGTASGTVTGAGLIRQSNNTSKALPGRIVYTIDRESGIIYPARMGLETFNSLKDYCWSAPYDSMRGCSEPGITSAPVFPSDWLPFNFKSLFRFGAKAGMATARAGGTNSVQQAASAMKGWLGNGYRTITNSKGDKVFLSADKLRKVRFDVKNPGNDMPHFHIEIFKNGRWRDAGPNHRYYFK